jgi:hypothetical protein
MKVGEGGGSIWVKGRGDPSSLMARSLGQSIPQMEINIPSPPPPPPPSPPPSLLPYPHKV